MVFLLLTAPASRNANPHCITTIKTYNYAYIRHQHVKMQKKRNSYIQNIIMETVRRKKISMFWEKLLCVSFNSCLTEYNEAANSWIDGRVLLSAISSALYNHMMLYLRCNVFQSIASTVFIIHPDRHTSANDFINLLINS